jgi:hypothetical protein
MEFIETRKVKIYMGSYSRARQAHTPGSYREVEVEVWKGDTLPAFAISGIVSPEGVHYCRRGWHKAYQEIVKGMEEYSIPPTYIRKYEEDYWVTKDTIDLIGERMLDRKEDFLRVVEDLAYYHKELEQFLEVGS